MLISENKTSNDEVVSILSILLWSLIRCMISPVILTSKNDIGRFISLMKKSEISEIFILAERWRSIQLLMSSSPVFPTNKNNWAKRIKYTKWIFWFCIPISTMLCVRKGKISCSILLAKSPILS